MGHPKILMTTLEQEVRCIIAGQLRINTEYIRGDKTLLDAGFDSLDLFDLADSVMAQFTVIVPDRMVSGTLTISSLTSLIDADYRRNERKGKLS
jgi:acyl carrier protein